MPELTDEQRETIRAGYNKPQILKTDLALDQEIPPTQWLWPGHIARGFVTAIVAHPWEGKSALALSLCKTLLEGGAWPDGTPCEAIPEDQKLLWIDTDSSLRQTDSTVYRLVDLAI